MWSKTIPHVVGEAARQNPKLTENTILLNYLFYLSQNFHLPGALALALAPFTFLSSLMNRYITGSLDPDCEL